MDTEQGIKDGLNFCVSAYPRQVGFIPIQKAQYHADWKTAMNGYKPEAVRAAFVEHCGVGEKWPTFADIKKILTRSPRPQPKTEMVVEPFEGTPTPKAVEFCRLVVSLLSYGDYLGRDPTKPGRHRSRRTNLMQPEKLEAKREDWQAELLRRRETIGTAYKKLAEGTALKSSRWNAFFSRLSATGEIPPTPHPQPRQGTIEDHPYTLTTNASGQDVVDFTNRVFSWQKPDGRG